MSPYPEFEEILSELSSAGARYLVVGAFAVAQYTEPRYTKDLDIWVDPTPENARRVWKALASFGAPLKNIGASDFEKEGLIYQVGVEPRRVDVITSLEGCTFAESWKRRHRAAIGRTAVSFLGKQDLIRNKRAVRRSQDLIDVERLEAVNPKKKQRRKRR